VFQADRPVMTTSITGQHHSGSAQYDRLLSKNGPLG